MGWDKKSPSIGFHVPNSKIETVPCYFYAAAARIPNSGFHTHVMVSGYLFRRIAPPDFICSGGSRRHLPHLFRRFAPPASCVTRASNFAIADVLRVSYHRRYGRPCRMSTRWHDYSVATHPVSTRPVPLSPPLHDCCDGRDFFNLMLESRCGDPWQTLGWSCHFGDTVFC